MERFKIPAQYDPKAQERLNKIQQSKGKIINIFQYMALAPALLEGYFAFSEQLTQGLLTAQDREIIALTSAHFHHCNYCASAHTVLAKNAGIAQETIDHLFNHQVDDSRHEALYDLTLALLKQRGQLSSEQILHARSAGLTDPEILETIGHVALNIMTNYFNNTVQTPIDFPKVSFHSS